MPAPFSTILFHLLWHAFLFFTFVILFFAFAICVLYYRSPCRLCESIALSSPWLFNKFLSPDFLFYDFMLMAHHYFQLYHLLNTVSQALFPLLSLSAPVIFPGYLLSNFNLIHHRILFLFLLAQAYCPVTCSNRPVFITRRPEEWAKHWLFWWWEQNVMDFYLYS